MRVIEPKQRALIEYGVAGRPLLGQSASGDVHVIKPFESGALLALIDGVGHGDGATVAAKLAAQIVQENAREPVISLVQRCHRAMAQTRGAVMTVASINALDDTVTWIGVGNVEGRLLRADKANSHPCESVLLRNGLLGLQLPALQAAVLPLAPGDMLIFATDGIHTGFEQGLSLAVPPSRVADQILKQHFKGTDDAMVVVVRYIGLPHE